jgi:hypothetical protein
MSVLVRPVDSADDTSFEIMRSVKAAYRPDSQSQHYITKKEAMNLIENQFPDTQYQGPVAVRMFVEGRPHSNASFFWYFTISEAEQIPIAGSSDYSEYIIDSFIMDYNSIAGGIENRQAISTGFHRSYDIQGRMAKLETPVGFIEKLEQARSGKRSAVEISREQIEPAKFTPIPLK